MLGSRPFARSEDHSVDVLVVEPRQLVRAGIQRVLADSGYLVVSGEAANCDEAIRLARNQQPKIILVNLPGATVDVLDGARKIHRQFPDIRVLVFAEESELIVQERLLQAGVAGCISSFCSVDELFAAIDTVLSGERYISDSLAQKLAERRLPGDLGSPFDQLTHRELQILLLVVEGKNTSAIARQLCLTQKTVNGYRNRLLEKLHVSTEVELMRLAASHGLVHIPQFG
jgi:two-component system invasion response regulator UvrY